MSLKRLGFPDIIGLVFLCGLLTNSSWIAGDPGVGWHLRTGQWVDANRAVPEVDPFLATTVDKAWVANQWLADLIFWKLHQLGGWPLLHIITVGIALVTYVFCVAPLVRRISNSGLVTFFVTFVAAILGSIQWVLRPVIFSFLCLAIVVAIVYRWYDSDADSTEHSETRWLFALPPLFCLWANLHPGFPLGIIFMACCGCSLWLHEGHVKPGRYLLWWGVFLACVFATLINPYGVELHRYIVGLVGDPFFMNLNKEWQSPDFQKGLFLPFLFVVFLLLMLAVRGGRWSWRLLEWLLIFGFCYMAFKHRRYIPFCGIVLAPVMARAFAAEVRAGDTPFSTIFERVLAHPSVNRIRSALWRVSQVDVTRGSRGGYFLACWLLATIYTLVFAQVPFSGGAEFSAPDQRYPKVAIDKMLEDDAQGMIFHTPNWGGYLTWRLWPNRRAFIDDRNQLNTSERYREYFALRNVEAPSESSAEKPSWKDVLARYNFRWALLEPNAPVVVMLGKDAGWELIHRDEHAVLFKRL